MATDSILPRGTGQWMEDAEGPRWWFDSGSLALDFAYTGGLDRPEESQPVADAAALNDWLVERFPEVAPTAGEREFRDATALRSAIGRLARQASRGADGRIRECSADDCDLVYLDTSRSGNRRWCSMQRCGNRAKVRAHRARAGARTPQ